MVHVKFVKRKKEEYISIRNYNIVFEDMIDHLFSSEIDPTKKVDGFSLNDLKNNKDGKVIDHIYEYQSLIDNSNIFYIGDSKYYKSESEAGNLSKYKQFTYAKNVIQFNIDFLKEKENIIANLMENNFIRLDNDHIYLTKKGFLLCDEICLKLI